MKQPEFVAVLTSSIWEWENFQLSELSHTKCIFKSELHGVDLKEGWAFFIQKINTRYCGLLLVDEDLNLHLCASLDNSTRIDIDEDLIGSGSRSVTISNASISTACSDPVTKYEFYLSNKYPELEVTFLGALTNLKELFNNQPDVFGSQDWRTKNQSWFLQFRLKYESEVVRIKDSMSSNRTTLVEEDNNRQTLIPDMERSGSINSVESRPRGGYVMDGSTGSERSCSFTGSVRSESSQISKRSIKIYTKPEDQPYVGFRDLKLFLTTFNVNMQTSTLEGEANFVHLVQDWLQHDDIMRNTPDIMVICMQECGGLNRVSNFLSSLDEKIQSDWKSAISSVLHPLHLTDSYEANVGCTYMIVYVNNSIKKDVTLKHKADVPLGQIGMANKGACAIQISVHEQKFLFIGLHLAAHDDHQSERMRQIEKLCFYYKPLIKSSHYAFWMGDFNFRAAVDEPVIQSYDFLSLENGFSEKYSDYRSKDEWRRQRLTTAGSDRIDFYNLSEAEISFPPTYKFKPGLKGHSTLAGTNIRSLPYEESHRPSWCDRIFYYSSNSESQLRVESYNCELKCTLSDHKPVILRILAQIEYLDRAKKYAEYRATEIRNNASRPNADLDEPLHNIPSEDDCIKLMDSYQIDTHLRLKEDHDEAIFLFRCPCGDGCSFYKQQFGGTEFEYSEALVDHIKGHNSPVSFITVNEYRGRIIAGYPADIGFDVQITERNIHELYKLKRRPFATLVKKSRYNKFEQAQIDLIFCLYREIPSDENFDKKKWLKGADKYIAVNINVAPYMHGLSPTALCYVEQPIYKESVTSLCDIVEISEKFLNQSKQFISFFQDNNSVKPPPLECPKEIVFAIDTILDFIKSCQRDEAALLSTQLFQMHSMKDQRETVNQPHLPQLLSLHSDDGSGDAEEDMGAAGMGGAVPLFSSSTGGSEDSLHFAINWLTGVTEYNKRPFPTTFENHLFVVDLSRALLLYFKSIEGSLFGEVALPNVNPRTTRQEIIQSLFIPEHNKTVINYFFQFLARHVVPHFPDDINFTDQETPLASLKNTLLDACFPQSKLELGLKKRNQVLQILLNQYSR